MISYQDAYDRIVEKAACLTPTVEQVPVATAVGRTLARRITSGVTVPPFDNTAMDGFALKGDDITKGIISFRCAGRIAAGDDAQSVLASSGECCEIMTGAPLPPGLDTVVPVEQSVRAGDQVSFTVKPSVGDHVRKAGSDFAVGDLVIEAGTMLNMAHILPLSALGISQVDVFAKINTGFIPTGREIIAAGSGAATGKIYNSSQPYAVSFLEQAGAVVTCEDIIPDDPALFQAAVTRRMQAGDRLILSTGAVSAGAYDFVADSLKALGAEILFHKVAIKPAKPILFARLPGDVLYVGLPGNPVSTAVGLEFFVKPLLSTALHQAPVLPVKARVKTPLRRKAGLRLFLKARVLVSNDGILDAYILDGQESYKTAPFLEMNAWAAVPEDRQVIEINDLIDIFPIGIFDRMS